MAKVEKDMARLAQGAALVVSRFMELQPVTKAGRSPMAAMHAHERWDNANRSGSHPRPEFNLNPFGRVGGVEFKGADASHTDPPTPGFRSQANNRTEQEAGGGSEQADHDKTSNLRPQSDSFPGHGSIHPIVSAGEGPAPAEQESSVPAGSAASTADIGSGESSSPYQTFQEDNRKAATPRSGFSRPKRGSAVPVSQMERIARMTGLGIGMAFGTAGEVARSAVSGSFAANGGLRGAILGEKNSDRLTLALCRMRGAALKFGQLLSIQDEHVIPKDSPLRQVIDRVREEAEHMPTEQLYKSLAKELGPEWRAKCKEFDHQPIAAASIGQVHKVVTLTGMEVALKIQYPGVAESIDSDISSLGMFLGPLAPRGLFLSTALENLRISMHSEVDYELEARNTERMRELLKDDPAFRVPKVAYELSGKRVLSTEWLPGIAFDKVEGLSQEVRNQVAYNMLKLTVRELFEFGTMQTDPNWSNFLYDVEGGTLNLIDFGATVDYPLEFCYQYACLVKAAVDRDKEALLRVSYDMGFLNGRESEDFLAAHTAAAFITGEPFAAETYDFGTCRMTERNSQHISTMLAGRLTPPPKFVYTLHRKLSGAFLSCIRLRAKISCRQMFLDHFDALEQRYLRRASQPEYSTNTEEGNRATVSGGAVILEATP